MFHLRSVLAVYLEETIGVGNFENTTFAPVRGKHLWLWRIDPHSGQLYHMLWVAENVHRYHTPDSGKRPRSNFFTQLLSPWLQKALDLQQILPWRT